MARKRWYSFSGILSRVLSQETEVVGTAYEVRQKFGARRVLATFATLAEATTYKNAYFFPDTLEIIEVASTKTQPAASKGVAVVPLLPIPLFPSPGKVLTTRGFWDVTSVTSPAGIVSNFAFGMIFLPAATVLDVSESMDPAVPVYSWRSSTEVPDPLLDDPGWFCYDSFVRVTTDVNQDPPFHSKSQRNFPAHSVLTVVAGVEVAVESLTSLRLNLGIRFRVLIEV